MRDSDPIAGGESGYGPLLGINIQGHYGRNIRWRVYPSQEKVYKEIGARRFRGILEQWSVGNGIPKTSRENKDKSIKIGQFKYIIEVNY